MAKTIKFNLVLDRYHARTLDDVREHFSIEDIFNYYENGLLLRWLSVRGYTEQHNAVEKIDRSLDMMDIIKQLIKIFEVEKNDSEIEKDIYILKYSREDRELKEKFKDNSFKAEQVLNDYFKGYHTLISHMLENKDNMAVLRADALEMLKYQDLFLKDSYRLYFHLYENAPKAIFAILTVEDLRAFWLGNLEECEKSQDVDSIAKSIAKAPQKTVYYHIKNSLLDSTKRGILKSILGDDLKIVTRDTNGMWDALEPGNVRVMIIATGTKINVKNAGDFKGRMEYDDVRNKLPILNGLEFQCSASTQSLLYMEV